MKTRRDFLAALGLGAGAAVFGFPEAALARGRWRRRGRCAPVCHPCRVPCRHGCYAGCNYACDDYLYSQANGVYYYACLCCQPQNNSHVIVPCGSGSLVHTPCDAGLLQQEANCFTLSGGWGTCPGRVRTLGRPGDYEHHYEATRGHTNFVAARPYYIGISPESGADLDTEIKNAANGVQVSDPYYVTFASKLVALYDLKDTNEGPLRGHGIGQEVTDQKTGTPPPDSHVHVTQVLDYYYQVTKDSEAVPPEKRRVYHVVTG